MDDLFRSEDGLGYHYTGEGQKRLSTALRVSELSIVALAVRNVPRETIAVIFGVSRECVSQRLRRHGVSPGRGRPRKANHLATPGR